MKLKDEADWARRNRKVPSHTVLAFEHPEKVNAVILQGPWRFRIVRELSRQEFVARCRENQAQPDNVAAVATAVCMTRAEHLAWAKERALEYRSKILIDSAEDVTQVPPEMKYFYSAELV